MAALLSQVIQINPMKDLEDKLDPGSLTIEGEEIGAISQDVKKSFDSLDQNVHHPLKIRYLLLHAYEHLKTDPRLYKQWLEVLHNRGIPSDLVNFVTLGHSSLSAPDSDLREPNMLSTGRGLGLGDTTSSCLSVKYILPLTEILADVSYKWGEISVSLNLPECVRSDIHNAILLTQSNKICLFIVLKEWIMGGHQHARSPTMDNLKKSLASQWVGLGNKASQLQEDLNKLGGSFVHKTLKAQQRPHCDAPLLEIISQSRAIEVTEEKSTLLEVQAVATCTHVNTITYKWVKDGCQLADDGINYFGASKQILCIKNATLASKGVYTCELKLHTDSDQTVVLQCKPITLTVNVLPRTKVLVDAYSSQPEIQNDSWPPVNRNTYVSLAILKREKIDSEDDSTHTVQGSIDDFLNKSEVVTFEEAFGKYRSGAFLLVKGRPGSGKTTLVRKISKDWADGKSILNGAKLVFLISPRLLVNKTINEMIDLLNLFYLNCTRSREVLKHLNDSNGEGVCFIIDGLDEYTNRQCFEESIIFRIIQSAYLPHSMKILTSCPVASASLTKMADRCTCIEVVGFQKEQLFEYTDSYAFKSALNDSKKLKSYLTEHPNVLQMCYLPLHAAMISYLYDKMRKDLPSTETEIYKLFTMLTLLRTMKRKDESAFISAAEDLTEDNKASFQKMCKFAFDVTTSKQELYQKDLTKQDELFLGFVSADFIYGLYGARHFFSFSHLTFQEYLAAYHISQLQKGVQMEVISIYGKDKNMQIVWKFYCGLTEFETHQPKFEEILRFHTDNDLFLCQCAYESQQASVCKCVVLCGDKGTLTFKDQTLSIYDLTSIGYVLSTAAPTIEKLTLHSCNIGDSVRILSYDLGGCSNLQCLDLSHNGIGDLGAESLSLDQYDNLHTLNLSCNEIGNHGARTLAESLEYSNSLESLNLEKNEIGADGLESLCAALQKCNLEVLNISSNSIGDKGAEVISDYLKINNNLLSLSIDHNNIYAGGVAYLATGLKHCCKLLSLKLDHNEISDHCAMILSDNLKHCQQIQTISLSSSRMTDDGAKAFSDCLASLTCLQTLNLNSNDISDIGAKSLADSLSHSYSLQTLDLKGNKISNEGAYALAKALELNFNLQKLDLSSNNTSDPVMI